MINMATAGMNWTATGISQPSFRGSVAYARPMPAPQRFPRATTMFCRGVSVALSACRIAATSLLGLPSAKGQRFAYKKVPRYEHPNSQYQ